MKNPLITQMVRKPAGRAHSGNQWIVGGCLWNYVSVMRAFTNSRNKLRKIAILRASPKKQRANKQYVKFKINQL
jgi:hypothetical protein